MTRSSRIRGLRGSCRSHFQCRLHAPVRRGVPAIEPVEVLERADAVLQQADNLLPRAPRRVDPVPLEPLDEVAGMGDRGEVVHRRDAARRKPAALADAHRKEVERLVQNAEAAAGQQAVEIGQEILRVTRLLRIVPDALLDQPAAEDGLEQAVLRRGRGDQARQPDPFQAAIGAVLPDVLRSCRQIIEQQHVGEHVEPFGLGHRQEPGETSGQIGVVGVEHGEPSPPRGLAGAVPADGGAAIDLVAQRAHPAVLGGEASRHLRRRIGRGIVDDHDLERHTLLGERRAHGTLEAALGIVGGQDDAHIRRFGLGACGWTCCGSGHGSGIACFGGAWPTPSQTAIKLP